MQEFHSSNTAILCQVLLRRAAFIRPHSRQSPRYSLPPISILKTSSTLRLTSHQRDFSALSITRLLMQATKTATILTSLGRNSWRLCMTKLGRMRIQISWKTSSAIAPGSRMYQLWKLSQTFALSLNSATSKKKATKEPQKTCLLPIHVVIHSNFHFRRMEGTKRNSFLNWTKL